MRRNAFWSAPAIVFMLLMTPSMVMAQSEKGFVRGLGGLTFGTETSSIIGGGVGFNVGRVVQITAEIGRMQNVMPKALQEEFDLVSDLLSTELGVPITLDARVPALYFSGGIRANVPTSSRVKPFVEVQAGVASISADFDAEVAGIDVSNELDNELDLESESKFLFAIGGGISTALSQNTAVDIGYRYTRIATEDPAINASALYAAFRWMFR